MPLYCYECLACKKEFELRHSVKDIPKGCVFCESKNLQKKINFVSNVKKHQPLGGKQKTGIVTKRAIEQAKIDLNNQKKDLKNK